ncbi:MAG TPA: hypothetical protein VFE18_17170 [Phenylobacterium sp.]|jgi:hypothetical protein|nr:hypothetical protein [Phenylobacterium sp.]HZZ69906.1 hypothetical protein [Phenylobacterium sp.]
MLKAILAAVAAAAIVVGFCLPATPRHAEPKSQIQQLDIGEG